MSCDSFAFRLTCASPHRCEVFVPCFLLFPTVHPLRLVDWWTLCFHFGELSLCGLLPPLNWDDGHHRSLVCLGVPWPSWLKCGQTRRGFHLTSSAWSLLASSWRMAAPFRITTSRRSPPSTWCCACEVVCRSSWRPWRARPSPSTSRPVTLLTMSRPRSKTRRGSHLTSSAWSLQASS